MEVSRLLTLTYIGILVLAFVIFDKALKWLWVSVDALNEIAIVGNLITLTTVLAAAGAVGLTMWLYKHQQVNTHLSEVILELRKVTWPGMSETKRSTLIVIIFSIFLSLFLWGSDQIWRRVTDIILSAGV
jgi:preprotein translocase subunit SecE